MTYILNIETTTTNCSVSLSQDGETLVLLEENNVGYSHAETLHVYIEKVLKKANIEFKDLNAVAVSKGPGSYTGLRIGVSAAKGLCFALNIPLIAVSTLKSLATQVKADRGVIIPLLDARRMEVYSAVFSHDFSEIREVKAEVITPDSFASYFNTDKVYFIGNGVEKTKSVIPNTNAKFIDDKLPSAKEMSNLAYEKYKKNDIEDVAYFEPYYLKDFIAIKSKK